MEVKITVVALSFLIALAKSSMVELNSEWRPNFGWELICSWNLFANDSLQSVRLYKSDQQFLIYRPERDGPKRSALVRLPNIELRADCYETQIYGVTGKCSMSLEILQPVREDLSYTCEVSGERPTFRVQSKTVEIEALVRPSDAQIQKINENDQSSGRLNLNCTSTGMPAPTLMWTIGDQMIPQDFSGSEWNYTSKLYHVWSSLSYTPVDSNSHAVCTPSTNKGLRQLEGQPAHYSEASTKSGATVMMLGVLLVLNLMR